MTNAPPTRKTHVTRIVGTNRQGERLTDIWVDLERIDIYKGAMQIPPDFQWQGVQRKLRWCDNPDDEDYSASGTPSRLIEIVKVCDPETQDVDDPDEWIDVPIIKGARSKGGGSESMGQGFMDRFKNTDSDDEPNTARISVVRKIAHCDTNIDDAARAAFQGDPGRREYVVEGEFYQKDIASKDDEQYVEHEIVTFFKPKTASLQAMGLGRQAKLLNQYLIDESDAPENKETGASGINPPYRLDPFQNIVNVQFTPPKAVMVGSSDEDDRFSSINSNDGLEWAAEFGAGATNAASGFGFTVVASEQDFVAFGKPTDGAACFILARHTGQIQRGTLQQGEIVWEGAGFIPVTDDGIAVFSCHFAGGLFFVGYSDGQSDKFLYAVSTNGRAFGLGINPFPGVTNAARGTAEDDNRTADPVAGGVAYDPDTGLYVVTGMYLRKYITVVDALGVPTPLHLNDRNFMSSVSANGFSWSPHYDTSEIGNGASSGPAGPAGSTSSSVAFGNGVFVAIGGRKGAVDFSGPLFTVKLNRPTAAALVSGNGSNWSPVSLPNQPGSTIDTESTATAVEFVKHRGLGDGFEGFFVISSLKVTNDEGPLTGGLFYSLTGAGWTQVQSQSGDVAFVMSTPNKDKGKIVNV